MATKLKKPAPNSPQRPKPVVGSPATSRTMMLAQASSNVPYSWSLSAVPGSANLKSTVTSDTTIVVSQSSRSDLVGRREHPGAPTQSYWAARALTAEALLSARETHYAEMRGLLQAEDVKRNVSVEKFCLVTRHEKRNKNKKQREISTLVKEHKERHAGLERLVVSVVVLVPGSYVIIH
jgi:hypothetical protein